jgi:hypothetical protein
MYTPNITPTRSLDDLRKLSYRDMNSAELMKLRQEDPAAYQVAEDAINGVTTAEVTTTPTNSPMPGKRTIWRNGEEVEIPSAVRYVNGIPVE